ncbi:hypothetical protein Hamer_G030696 [Homarus americanus]|uniref:Uncharacterized protein n=1 Tax=Homarus americanus TaxID=6706 RepID=A0A8J5JQ31_HOMAM|nr:hypothetical protein Hamer_G030696 [Homarus americanus]
MTSASLYEAYQSIKHLVEHLVDFGLTLPDNTTARKSTVLSLIIQSDHQRETQPISRENQY